MPHHGHSTIILIIGVGGVVGKLTTCGSRLTLLLLELLVMAKFAAISTFYRIDLLAWSSMKTPPSVERSTVVPAFLLKVGVALKR